MWPSGTQADQAATEIDDATGEDGDFRPYNAALAAHGAAAPWSDPSGVVSVASHTAFYALRAADPVPESSTRAGGRGPNGGHRGRDRRSHRGPPPEVREFL
ncbi:hypothetical protein PX52LOC_05960 [Limnoglobus roseus]|uniref:Uncharacterized protein n=1 Tax=Limnoglobus roseus TaxID=2598579 RepID=A0A5C1AJ68_9BACT|nr:hypothetical protein PX52LOC_05960 [Limnoglobus roseus]